MKTYDVKITQHYSVNNVVAANREQAIRKVSEDYAWTNDAHLKDIVFNAEDSKEQLLK